MVARICFGVRVVTIRNPLFATEPCGYTREAAEERVTPPPVT